MPSTTVRLFLSAAILLSFAARAHAQIDARMLRYPAVSKNQIAFVYAGDIWLVSREGGSAFRLTSSPGEESFPRFSPDGSKVAYSASYDGNVDVFVIPSAGGEPARLTYHPMADRVLGWTPDGRSVLFASSRESGRQRYAQFYTVGLAGGLPARLPVPYGEFGAYSPDGRQFVYMPMAQDFRNWKRYRGGWSPDLWLFDLTTKAAKNITSNPANDAQPMWHGTTIYFVSDRGTNERNNIWAYDVKSGASRQVTQFADFDITFPSLGPDGLVFQAGGRLYFMDVASGKPREVPVRVFTDETTLRQRTAKVENLIQWATVSPTGKRALFEARGDVFTAPAEFGPVVNASRTSGVAERYPRWSPDGKSLAYWSDRSGEYELAVRPADGAGEEKKLTSLGAGFRYAPHWSPDSKKVAFVDQAMRIHLTDIASGRTVKIDESPEWMNHGALAGFEFDWSPDSRWLAYSRPTGDSNGSIFLFDTKSSKLTRATSGYLNDGQPAFDPDGKYLYYASDREFTPVYGSFDNSWTYPNPTRLVAVPLRKDVPSPLHARNDYEGQPDTKKPEEKTDEKKGEKKDDAAKPAADVKSVEIDLDGFDARAVVLPPAAGNYADIQAIKGKLLFRRLPRTGAAETKSPILYFDFTEREEKPVLDDADGFEVTADGKKMLVRAQNRYAILEIKSPQKFEKPIATADMEAPVDPRAEWKQMFEDVYRFQRDYFYDPGMHGVDWAAMKARYGKLLQDAVTRWDVDFIIGEFIGELNASHTYYGGGEKESAPARNVGLLGIDWELADGAYRVKSIIRGGPWDADVRAPLAEPGVNVKAGDYILAVNGVPLDTKQDPYAAFQGLGNKTVLLTVNSKPSADGSRQVLAKTLTSEVELRYRAWIEERRQIVDQATGGTVGYIYVQSTGVDAQNELVKQFMGQWKKDGLIIDERWNAGGQIPDRFIELLNRPILAYWAVRDGASWQWPPVAHRGAQVMLINGWSGSGGDAFPTYFKQAGIGPLIGTRTWGGLIGISGAPVLVDGGNVTVPTFRMYDPKGAWFAEGHGVEPDIEVVDDPSQLAQGTDPQLARAIKEVQDLIAKRPTTPGRPAPEKRVPRGGR
ncbi:MAG TPA: PDZ domain-containing protein [Vicinamibacterales bacterium]|nr:PDZ domain-containing protein [Vicinamibacterales bacterium]